MKEVLGLFTFGIGALLFLAFFTTLKPTVVVAASGPCKPGQCSTKAPLRSPAIAARSTTADVPDAANRRTN
jgi:hypothetical protein